MANACTNTTAKTSSPRWCSTVKRWWVWFAIDPETKVLLSLHLGSRKTDSAMGFVHALVATFTPGYCPLFLSDGLPAYFYALTAHWGQWVGDKWQVTSQLAYAQMIKILRWRHLIACFPRVLCGSLPSIRGHLRNAGFSGQIQTAYIERVNLTARQHIAALLRRSWSTYRKPARLQAHLELFRGFYHFIRPHQSLTQHRLERTPAMAAGWTDHLLCGFTGSRQGVFRGFEAGPRGGGMSEASTDPMRFQWT